MTPPPTPDEIRDASMERFNELAAAKYDKGQREHKTVLTEVVNLEMLEEEIIDAWHYVQAMRQKLNRTKNDKKNCSHCGNPDCGCD